MQSICCLHFMCMHGLHGTLKICCRPLLGFDSGNATLGMQVLWLDLTAAKARYGRWIGGELPQFTEFARTTRARTARQKEAEVKILCLAWNTLYP